MHIVRSVPGLRVLEVEIVYVMLAPTTLLLLLNLRRLERECEPLSFTKQRQKTVSEVNSWCSQGGTNPSKQKPYHIMLCLHSQRRESKNKTRMEFATPPYAPSIRTPLPPTHLHTIRRHKVPPGSRGQVGDIPGSGHRLLSRSSAPPTPVVRRVFACFRPVTAERELLCGGAWPAIATGISLACEREGGRES